MRSRRPTFAVLAMTFWSVCWVGSLDAQEASRSWMLTAGGGYSTQLDAGSSGQGSFSVGASALGTHGRRLSFGVEGGYDRHEASEARGDFWWDGTNITSSECPAPCAWRHVKFTHKNFGSAWHLGGVLRYSFAPGGALVPSAEVGLGLYGVRSLNVRQVRDATTGFALPELTWGGGSTDWAPGVSGALGLDVFPGEGRIGIGAVARLRVAGRPAESQLFGIGFGSLQVRVTARLGRHRSRA